MNLTSCAFSQKNRWMWPKGYKATALVPLASGVARVWGGDKSLLFVQSEFQSDLRLPAASCPSFLGLTLGLPPLTRNFVSSCIGRTSILVSRLSMGVCGSLQFSCSVYIAKARLPGTR